VLSTSLAYGAPQEAVIAGERGTIRIPHGFSQPDRYIVEADGPPRESCFPREGYGYHLEARAVTECVAAGAVACETVPWAMSRRIIKTLDQIRAQWGLEYPADRPAS